MTKSNCVRVATSIASLALFAGCYRAPQVDDVVGVWSAENGDQLALETDGSVHAERFNPHCWDENAPALTLSGAGTWSIQEQRSLFDQVAVVLHFPDALVTTQVWYGNDGKLFCIAGDPDSADYVRFERTEGANP